MGSRQEIGIVIVVILIALSGWLSQSTSKVVEEETFDCHQPAVIVDQNKIPALVCRTTKNTQQRLKSLKKYLKL
jgi:hypothetical protein